jgi:hypothetical protein
VLFWIVYTREFNHSSCIVLQDDLDQHHSWGPQKGQWYLEGMVWKRGAFPSPTTDLLLFVYIESLDVQLGPAVFGNERNKVLSKVP